MNPTDNIVMITFSNDDGRLWVKAETDEEAVTKYNDPQLTEMFEAGDILTFTHMTRAVANEEPGIYIVEEKIEHDAQ